jgi:hypothetical protein
MEPVTNSSPHPSCQWGSESLVTNLAALHTSRQGPPWAGRASPSPILTEGNWLAKRKVPGTGVAWGTLAQVVAYWEYRCPQLEGYP